MSENRGETGEERKNNGQFKPGQSGNPGGRPKKPPEIETYAKKAPAKLYALANNPNTPTKLQKEIWQFFYEAQYGKAKQAVDLDFEEKNFEVTVTVKE